MDALGSVAESFKATLNKYTDRRVDAL